MSLAADTTWDATQGTQATMPKDPRPPALRLMAYRSNISKRDPARAIWCEETRNRLNGTPVRLSAQAPPKDSKAKTGKPSAPLGQQERIDARVKARGPSSLRHEVRPTEDTPAEAAHHHQKRRPDALLTPGSGAAAMPRRPGQSKGGLYGARRAPTTAPSEAQMAPARASATQARRAHISKDEVALLAMDIDEEPSHAAKPTGRALAERLYHRPDITRSEVTLSATRPGEPTSPPPDVGQMPLMRKRGRDEAGDVLEVAPHPKRLACLQKQRKCARRLAPRRRSRVSRLGVTSNNATISYPRRARARCRAFRRGPKRVEFGCTGW